MTVSKNASLFIDDSSKFGSENTIACDTLPIPLFSVAANWLQLNGIDHEITPFSLLNVKSYG